MRAGQQLEAFSTTFGLLASLAFHAAIFAYVASRTANFDFDFDLALPTEVEFGLTEAMVAEPGAQGSSEARVGGASGASAGGAYFGLDAGVPMPEDETTRAVDASSNGDADPKPDGEEVVRDRKTAEDSKTDDEGAALEPIPVGPSAISGPSRIPPGAQLALRIDMKRIRESPLGSDVTQFLRGVPDWQMLLDGSGIDPVEDLDRLLLASPNLERDRLVLAGRHRRDEAFSSQSVGRMARARGRRVSWKQRFGVRVAPWHNLDPTRRSIALLSAQHFAITRPKDLQRVLALTKARELRDAEEEGVVAARGPDALLSMGPQEALSLEIEGVHRFVRGSARHVPVRLRIAIRETGPNQATVNALATYRSMRDAEEASRYWRKVADFYSQQLVMTLAGFGRTLRRMTLAPKGERVRVSFTLSSDQIRFILSYLEGRLGVAGATSRPLPAPKGPNAQSPPRDTSISEPAKKGP